MARHSNVEKLASDIKRHIDSTQQKYIRRAISTTEIPTEELDILYLYLSVHLISELYGSNWNKETRAFYARYRNKKAEEKSKELDEKGELFEPYDPAGIGDWKYAERIRQKVFRSLEKIINQDVGTIGHNQFVQAAKTLLDNAEKTKADAIEIMAAYESQLLILADFLVGNFLLELGGLIKTEFRKAEDEVISKLKEINELSEKHIKIWEEQIDKIVRNFELKRYELLLAETMAKNSQVSDAFDFTKDLIDNYKATESVPIDDKHTAKLKEFIRKREID